ncbi:hypothetical protein [Opitutus sp. GAS368]|uniref:hypothetical protein n=1 Tax=Opitutus sp. GAS368 TaxID=1882749 RepID=UPI0012FE6501|nr:hypothetical protein [Opitutus sp. GAS368]
MEERPKVVLPIFATKPDGGVDLIGSGILLRARNVELLVTAAHVLALKASNTLCVPIGGTNYWALNQSFTISSESLEGAQNESRPDLGYMVLTTQLRDRLMLAGWSFLVVCPASFTTDGESFSGKIGAVEGFPRAENEQSPHAVSALIAFPFFTDKILWRFGYDTQKFVGLRFQHTLRNAGEPPRELWPECMSGGPIWQVDGERLKLAGIVAQYYSSKSLLLGTRIDLLLRFLRSVGIDTRDPASP